jgi:hypothetical protein
MKCLFFTFSIVVLTGCSSPSKTASTTFANSIKEIKFVSEFIIPNDAQFENTTVGGLSGIDYDAKREVYYLACDDPSTLNPSRFYTARVMISEKGIESVLNSGVDTLWNKEGKLFPGLNEDRSHSADVEAMRYDPSRDELIWSSEGQRFLKDNIWYLQDPAIVITDRHGHYKDSFALPSNMRIQVRENGPRHNSVFEGLSFDDDFSHLYVSVEEPIFEDGPRAGAGDSTALIRILKFNRKIKQCVAQYAYRLDAVRYAPDPPGAFKINGATDILNLGNEQFIIIERAFSAGRISNDVRVYFADASDAEDISSIPSLVTHTPVKLMTKKLLLDVNTSSKRDVFNIEGVTFGPVLPNGNRSLVFVADNNFNERQKTQFLLFELLSR